LAVVMLSNVVVVRNIVFVRRHHAVRAHAVTDGSHELPSVVCPVVSTELFVLAGLTRTENL